MKRDQKQFLEMSRIIYKILQLEGFLQLDAKDYLK